MNQYLLEFVNKTFNDPGSAIDFGAGQFFDVACMKQLGWNVRGVDLNMGIDLEQPFVSEHGPFDLVYSNYVLQKINNHEQFIKNIFANLKPGGYMFITTFDETDEKSRNGVRKNNILKILKSQGFDSIEMSVFPHYDNDLGHKHWHQILQIIAKKGGI